MKKWLGLLMAYSLIASDGFSQTANYIRPSYFGVSFFLNDFATAQRIRTTSLSSTFRNKQFGKVKNMAPGIGLSYFKGLKNHIDFSSTLASSFVSIPTGSEASSVVGDRFLLEADATVNLKMFTEAFRFTPYLIAGVGGGMYGGEFSAFVPLGGGFKLNLFDEASLFISTQYRVPVTTENNNYHFMHSFGVAGIIGRKREQEVKTIEIP